MEKMKMDTLYELLETGNFNENTDGALIWAIFELESSYSTIESKKIERLYELQRKHQECFELGYS